LESAPGLGGAQAALQAGLWNAVIRPVQKLWITTDQTHIVYLIPSLTLSPEIPSWARFVSSLADADQCA
jgi:hypothetical protein